MKTNPITEMKNDTEIMEAYEEALLKIAQHNLGQYAEDDLGGVAYEMLNTARAVLGWEEE